MRLTPLVQMSFTLLTLLSLIASPQAPSSSACLQSIERPSYPLIARDYDSQGVVTAHFTIGEDGQVQDAAYESKERITPKGNKTLATEVQRAVEGTHLDSRCKGEYTVVYRFTLNAERSGEPHTSITFNAPNEYAINANHDMLICSVYSMKTPLWKKRVWSRLRRRGQPKTIIATECS